MKIQYLKLVNFKNILAATGKRILEIDFRKSKHRITVIIGPNGSGKSSILREMHPFPNSGGTDNRNIKELIIEDSEGLKEVHVQDHSYLYKIRHHYTKSGSVKSYIEKDGDELNGNGNVTSFYECIYNEFGLAKEFLNLVRLGANDSNFIKMSATERKKFTTSLLDDVVVYNKLFKIISEDLRIVRASVKANADKMSKLKIYSPEELDFDIKDAETKLVSAEDSQRKLYEEKAVIESQCSAILKGETVGDINESVKEKHKELAVITKKLERLSDVESTDKLMVRISENKEKLNVLQRESVYLNESIKDGIKLVTDYQTNIDNLKFELGKFNIGEEDRLVSLIDEYETKLETTLARYKNLDIPYSVTDLKEGLDLLKGIHEVANMMVGFNNAAKKELVWLYIENSGANQEPYIARKMVNAEAKLEKAKASRVSMIHRNKVEFSEKRFMLKPAGCQYTNCSMEAFYKSITEEEKFDTKEIDRTISKLEKEVDAIDDYVAINSNIQYIRMILDSNKRLIEKLPPEYFVFDDILRAIEIDSKFFSEEEYTVLINLTEGKNMYTEYLNKVETCKKELAALQETTKATKIIRDQLNKAQEDRDNVNKERHINQEKLFKVESDIVALNVNIEQLENDLELSNQSDSYRSKVNELTEVIKDKTNDINTIIQLSNRLKEIGKEISESEYYVRSYRDKSELLRRNKILYDDLIKEREELAVKFDEMSDIRESLSSSKGIPLYYMKVYMMGSLSHINDLLNIAYGGSLEVTKFIIDEDTFLIPYKKNGILVPDVRSCSQGEETFLLMAISFAFMSRSMERYNIPLFDELDAALDQSKRENFLKILNTELDDIDAEQAMFITHNNAFYDEPVDAIIMGTDGINIDNFKNINIIHNEAE